MESLIFQQYTWYFTCSREIQKATQNFTTVLGQGSFGTVYKATMPAGGVVAVKVLASNSRQGEKEFQTEVCHEQMTILMLDKVELKRNSIFVFLFFSPLLFFLLKILISIPNFEGINLWFVDDLIFVG